MASYIQFIIVVFVVVVVVVVVVVCKFYYYCEIFDLHVLKLMPLKIP